MLTQQDIDLHRLIAHMFESLEGISDLSEWEDKFIESIRDQYEKKGFLSVKQRDILERIYTEKTK